MKQLCEGGMIQGVINVASSFQKVLQEAQHHVEHLKPDLEASARSLQESILCIDEHILGMMLSDVKSIVAFFPNKMCSEAGFVFGGRHFLYHLV